MTRRDFLKMMAVASAAGLLLPCNGYAGPDVLSEFYDLPPFGQLTSNAHDGLPSATGPDIFSQTLDQHRYR